MAFGFIRIDRHHGHAPGGIVSAQLVHPIFTADHEWTVITRENDDEDFGILEAREVTSFAIDTRQIEVGGLCVELECECHIGSLYKRCAEAHPRGQPTNPELRVKVLSSLYPARLCSK